MAGASLPPSATCTWLIAKRLPAPWCHLPQVVARFFGLMVERGSADDRMLCTPWQLAQLATVSLPSFAASPWKEASKLTTRSEGRLNRRESCTFPWQFPQVSRMLPAYTGEAVLLGARMECSPWQSVQSGACVMPLASACPWTLVRNCPATSLWHIPQVSGTFCRNSADLGRCSSCAAPWHTWQSGAAPLPFFIACPCTPRS